MSLGMDIAYAVGGVLSSPVWAFQLLRTGKWRTDWPGRFGGAGELESWKAGNEEAGGRLLIHAVSVGEVNLVRLLIEELASTEPGAPAPRIVVSTTTNTGFARATQLYGHRHAVVRYPLDLGFAVRRFLDAVRPDAVALVENEVWPNFTEACARRGIPVCVINGRLTERSHRRYRLAGPIARRMYGRLTRVAAQTEAYARRFVDLGVPAERVDALDTMKWDTAELADDVPGADELASELGVDRGRAVVALGSTGETEEAALVEAVRRACGEAVQVIVVPRKPERFDEVARLWPDIVRRSQRRGAGAASDTGTRVDARSRASSLRPQASGLFLLDTMGELRKAYALADVVIVGRSFNGWGGSDPIEPVALGRPTIVGPDHANFAEVVAALRDGGGIEVVSDVAEAARRVRELLGDAGRAGRLAEAGRGVIRCRQGATRRHAQMLRSILAAATGRRRGGTIEKRATG